MEIGRRTQEKSVNSVNQGHGVDGVVEDVDEVVCLSVGERREERGW